MELCVLLNATLVKKNLRVSPSDVRLRPVLLYLVMVRVLEPQELVIVLVTYSKVLIAKRIIFCCL